MEESGIQMINSGKQKEQFDILINIFTLLSFSFSSIQLIFLMIIVFVAWRMKWIELQLTSIHCMFGKKEIIIAENHVEKQKQKRGN